MIYTIMIVLAIVAIGYTIRPLLGESKAGRQKDYPREEDPYRLLLRQLQEVEFDHAAGKLGREEFNTLRAELQNALDEQTKDPKTPGTASYA